MKTTIRPKAYGALLIAAITLAAFQSAPLFMPNVLAEDTKSSLNSYDIKFIKEAGQSSKDETAIAELGTKKAERSDVKELAEVLLRDYTAWNSELQELAGKKQVFLSAMISPTGAQKFQNLEKYFGPGFDRAFVTMMETARKNAIYAFEKAEKKVQDSDMKVWVSKTLLSFRMQLDKLKDIKSKLPSEPATDLNFPPI